MQHKDILSEIQCENNKSICSRNEIEKYLNIDQINEISQGKTLKVANRTFMNDKNVTICAIV